MQDLGTVHSIWDSFTSNIIGEKKAPTDRFGQKWCNVAEDCRSQGSLGRRSQGSVAGPGNQGSVGCRNQQNDFHFRTTSVSLGQGIAAQ
jgi:hypothetical protein